MSMIQMVLSLALLGQDADSKASLELLQERVHTTRISLSPGAKSKDAAIDARLVKKPVFRYSDELRQIEDAGIWVWTDQNRPVAAMKVERYKPKRFPTPWLYCFTSLSTELVHADWTDAEPFQARKPGLTWKPLTDDPAGTRRARLGQMRGLAQQFSAEILRNAEGTDRIQMRLLTQPLYRYEESKDVLDGAIFGFTGTGTNPDVLLLFDLPLNGGWRFGLAGMTAEGVSVKLKENVVHEVPHTAGKSNIFDTWCNFHPTK